MAYLLEMQDITKMYPGTKALDKVKFQLEKGTVHALMGENGAGKSTLMKVLAGICQPNAGRIIYDGKEITIENPIKAFHLGISMIHQELMPIPEMTIAENIFLGREPIKFGMVDYKTLHKQTKDLLEHIGITIHSSTKMKELKVSDMQLVEIAKAISYDSKIIIMDEPTSAITDKEVDKLFAVIKELIANGKSIIYISHKMDEIFRVSDYITIFRDGHYVGTEKTEEISTEQLISMMVGRELTDIFPKRKEIARGEEIFSVKNLSQKKKFKNISFDLHKGEILGIAGLMGSGRTEVMEAIFGITKLNAGEIFIHKKKVKINQPIDAIKKGVAFVTEDRKLKGLSLPLSVKHNMTLSSLNTYSWKGIIKEKKEKKDVHEQISFLSVKTPGMNVEVKTLSGGNQQKVVLGKWIMTQPEILILDEPTRGIDIGAKTEIYKLMNQFVEKGVGIIMISSELPEVLGMSDRILVFHEGSIAGELSKEDFCQENVMHLATGQRNREVNENA